MPETEYARRVTLAVSLDGYDISGDFAPYLLDFTYTDNASGKADEVQITLHNRDGRFSGEWLPKKGMEIEASIICTDWEAPGDICELPCGTFKIDELDFSGPPDKITIKAVSADLSGPLRDEKKTRAWEKMTLERLAGQIAQENGLELYYAGPEHKFERQDQRNEGDIAFLNRLCSERSMNCKVHKGMIVLFDADEAEMAEESLVILKTGDMWSPSSYSFKISSAGTDYTDSEVAYSDPKTGTTHKAKVNSKKETRSVEGRKKTLTVQKRAESAADAATLGKSELHAANVKEQSANVEIMGCPDIAAGQMVLLDEFGEFTGRYFIKTATHKVSGSGKYSTSLELETSAPTEVEGAFDEKSEAALAARATNNFAPNERLEKQKIENERYEELFNQIWEIIPDDFTETERLLLCLPEIAQAMASRMFLEMDKIGWELLVSFFHRYFSHKPSEPDGEPFWISMEWVLRFIRGRFAYAEITSPITFMAPAAVNRLTDYLISKGYLCNEEKSFDFTTLPWQEWNDAAYQFAVVRGFACLYADGLMAAMGDFLLRALPGGRVIPLDGGGHKIIVNKLAIFAEDTFNFDGVENYHYWSCIQKNFNFGSAADYTKLTNQIFRAFMQDRLYGKEFLILSEPYPVEDFPGFHYVVDI